MVLRNGKIKALAGYQPWPPRSKITYFTKDLNQESLQRLTRIYDPDDWSESPQGTKAYYSLQTNEIVFPAGILQKPLYDLYNPPAVNYGALGSILGHEIIHAFDQVGASYDLNGIERDWWSNFTSKNFVNQSQCVIDSYMRYINETNQVSDENEYRFCTKEEITHWLIQRGTGQSAAIRTLYENLADMGGLKISKRAFDIYLKKNR